jgi:hypothetical protein
VANLFQHSSPSPSRPITPIEEEIKEAILFSISGHRCFWYSSLLLNNAKSQVSGLLRHCHYHHGTIKKHEQGNLSYELVPTDYKNAQQWLFGN